MLKTNLIDKLRSALENNDPEAIECVLSIVARVNAVDLTNEEAQQLHNIRTGFLVLELENPVVPVRKVGAEVIWGRQ